MADPITAEQVARAIEAARADEGGISDALGGWQWDKRAPDYVRVAWGKPSLPDFIAALTRWHAELVVAETSRKVARWDGESHWELSPAHTLSNMTAAEGVSSYTEKSTVTMRAAYAAALSAEEERRGAQLLADEEARAEAFHAEPDHLAYADSPVWDDGPLPTPTPERPAPRFKVGDCPRFKKGGAS